MPNVTTEPWITMAQRIPKKYLEPQILPFPKVMDKISNESVLFSTKGSSSSDVAHPYKRRCSFRVRRVSTSAPTAQHLIPNNKMLTQVLAHPAADSIATSSSNSAPQNLIDPLILSHHKLVMMFLKMMNIMKLTMMFTQRIVFLQTIMVFPQELLKVF